MGYSASRNAGQRSLHYFWNRSPHGNCKCNALPSVGVISSVCGISLGLMAPTCVQHIFLCGWLPLRVQMWTRTRNHLHKCEPGLTVILTMVLRGRKWGRNKDAERNKNLTGVPAFPSPLMHFFFCLCSCWRIPPLLVWWNHCHKGVFVLSHTIKKNNNLVRHLNFPVLGLFYFLESTEETSRSFRWQLFHMERS